MRGRRTSAVGQEREAATAAPVSATATASVEAATIAPTDKTGYVHRGAGLNPGETNSKPYRNIPVNPGNGTVRTMKKLSSLYMILLMLRQQQRLLRLSLRKGILPQLASLTLLPKPWEPAFRSRPLSINMLRNMPRAPSCITTSRHHRHHQLMQVIAMTGTII